jgi:PIN domain
LKTEFVLIDFENTQPEDVASLNGGRYKIKVFLGAQQAKIPLAMARALQALGPHAEYIQINGNGNNAVDFHIAYYIGRFAATAPDAQFHVISKDTGFDPLLKHLKDQGISCQRLTSLAAVTSTKRNRALNEDRVGAVVENLAKRKSAKPRTAKALRTTIQTLFANEGLTEGEVDELIEQLIGRGVIKISDGKVHYEVPV